MRISIREGDSGYNLWQDFSKAIVQCNGEQLCSPSDHPFGYNVITADEMLGFVEILDTNMFGLAQYDEDGNVITKKLRGHVVITFT